MCLGRETQLLSTHPKITPFSRTLDIYFKLALDSHLSIECRCLNPQSRVLSNKDGRQIFPSSVQFPLSLDSPNVGNNESPVLPFRKIPSPRVPFGSHRLYKVNRLREINGSQKDTQWMGMSKVFQLLGLQYCHSFHLSTIWPFKF